MSFPMTAIPDSNTEILTEMFVDAKRINLERFIERTRKNVPLQHALVDDKNKELLIGHIINMDQVGQALVMAYEKPPWSIFKTLHGRYTLQPLQNPDSRVTEYLTGPESKFWSLVVPRHGMFHGAGGFEVGYTGWESDARLSTTVLCSAEGDKQKRGMYALAKGIEGSTSFVPPCCICASLGPCIFGSWVSAVCMYPCIERNNSDSHHIRLRENNVFVQVDSHSVMDTPGVGGHIRTHSKDVYDRTTAFGHSHISQSVVPVPGICGEIIRMPPWSAVIPLQDVDIRIHRKERIPPFQEDFLGRSCTACCCAQLYLPTVVVHAYGVPVAAKEFVSNADEFVEAFRRQKRALSSDGGIRDEQLAAQARQHFRRSWINLDRVRRGMPSLGHDAGHTVEVEAVAVPVSEESIGLYNHYYVPSQEIMRETNPRTEIEASTNDHSSSAYHRF